MSVLISLRNISKSYGKKQVLDDINIDICKGELITIRGKSGSGKSSLLNILGLLDAYNQGSYHYNEKSVLDKGYSEYLRTNSMGFIFQSYYLIENLNIEDNVIMPFFYSNKKLDTEFYENLDMYLDKFGLLKLKKDKVKNLSGGERQRVAIVRAIMKNPDIIFADEPTGNLDPLNSKIVESELKNLSDSGKTVVVVTHSEDYFLNADKRYYIEDGKLVNE